MLIHFRSPVGRRAGRPRSVSESGHSQSSGSDVSARLALLATPGRTASNNLHDAQSMRTERPRKSRHSSGKAHGGGRGGREGRSPYQEGGQSRKLLLPPTSAGSGDEDDVGEARKPRPPPLPDIMHDWEIIVKSLKANERREKQEVSKGSSTSGETKSARQRRQESRSTEEPVSTNRKLDFSGEQRVLPAEASKPSNSTFEADSDKENSRLTEKPAASCPDSTEDNNDNQIQPPVPAASPGEMSDSSSEQNSQTTDLLGNLNSDVEKQKVGNINIVNKKSTKSSADRRTEGESDECDEEKSKSGERTPRKAEEDDRFTCNFEGFQSIVSKDGWLVNDSMEDEVNDESFEGFTSEGVQNLLENKKVCTESCTVPGAGELEAPLLCRQQCGGQAGVLHGHVISAVHLQATRMHSTF
ncbi:hypothetical protein C7M84_020090 [Penaeus vannamei]|uniref:Uncharacterized protein n=1 Tax=Penaeus vannamei TaxID=6689 RepID=A0A3R7LQZ7_PENVA|nr:hypothetical protein C7M84_020090 [Penaeus vannamei]